MCEVINRIDVKQLVVSLKPKFKETFAVVVDVKESSVVHVVKSEL